MHFGQVPKTSGRRNLRFLHVSFCTSLKARTDWQFVFLLGPLLLHWSMSRGPYTLKHWQLNGNRQVSFCLPCSTHYIVSKSEYLNAHKTIQQRSEIVQHLSSWWLNQPIWKICLSNWIISTGIGMKITKIFEITNQIFYNIFYLGFLQVYIPKIIRDENLTLITWMIVQWVVN